MRAFHPVLMLGALTLAAICAPDTGYALQAAAGTTAPQSSPATPQSPAPTAPPKSGNVTALLKPPLDTVWETVGSLQMERWKRGVMRDEATGNILSIRHDVESTLPDLLQQADANPTAASKMLPVSRNINALYDVVLRVVNAARVAAPGDQFAALQEALTGLEKARHEFEDRIQEAAAAQEKQIGDLQVALKTQPKPAPCPVAPVAATPPAAPAKKTPPKKRKPAPAPATTPPATNAQPAKPQPNATAKPNQ